MNDMSTTYTNPHTVEVAHDTELLRLLSASYRASATVSATADKLRSAACTAHHDRRSNKVSYWSKQFESMDLADVPVGTIVQTYDSRNGTQYQVVTKDGKLTWASTDDARTAPLDGVAGDPYRTDTPEKAAAAAAAYDAAVAAAHDAQEAITEHEKAYTGWNRYIAVLGGHVHRDMNCSTCYPTTMYAPVPSLAATTPDQAIALVGSTMCSVCFPLAPVDQTTSKLTEAVVNVLINEGDAAFRAKLAEIAAKAAEKCQATPYDHDRSHQHLYRPWATCNQCGASVSLTSTGKQRAHKPKAGS